MNKQDLIEKIVPEEAENQQVSEYYSGFNACCDQVFQNIESLDLNGWVRVEEIREWTKKRKRFISKPVDELGRVEAPSTIIEIARNQSYNQALEDLLQELDKIN